MRKIEPCSMYPGRRVDPRYPADGYTDVTCRVQPHSVGVPVTGSRLQAAVSQLVAHIVM